MIFPHMLEDYYELSKIKAPTEAIAQYEDWPELYDEDQLAKNEVPVYCAVYMDDMYVDFDFSRDTASKIQGAKIFVTNMMYHDAVRSRMDEVVRNVWALRDDSIDWGYWDFIRVVDFNRSFMVHGNVWNHMIPAAITSGSRGFSGTWVQGKDNTRPTCRIMPCHELVFQAPDSE